MDSLAGTKAAKSPGLGGVLLCIWIVFSLAGCVRVSRYAYLSSCDRDIQKATKAIEAAKNDVQRAAGYADRTDAYAEKARYSRAFAALNPRSRYRLADAYCQRGSVS